MLINSEIINKLKIKNGQKGIFLNTPEDIKLLGPLPEEVKLESDLSKGPFDFIQLFVHNIAELEVWAPKVLESINYDGLLWIAYPKKSSKIKTDINRDNGWDILINTGYAGISLISINDIWSSMRFRPIEKIKSSKKKWSNKNKL